MQATRVPRCFSSEEKYYMCGRCQNHIVLAQNIVYRIYQYRVPAVQLCPLVQNGRSKLSMERLSYWNGSQRLSGYAEMLPEPVPGPEPAFRLVHEPHLPILINIDLNPLQATVGYNVPNVPQPQPPAEGDDDPEPVPGPEPHLPNLIDMDMNMNPLQAIVGYNVTNVPQPQRTTCRRG